MILYKILYIISYSALYTFCSHVANVARQNVCLACVRDEDDCCIIVEEFMCLIYGEQINKLFNLRT